jgi:hypothetical protein
MKKYFIFLCFVFSVEIFAQIGVDSDFVIGYADAKFGGYKIEKYSEFEHIPTDIYYTEFTAFVWVWKAIYFGGGVTIQTISQKGFTGGELYYILPNFSSDFLSYNFEAGIVLGYFRVFVSHDCAHPQVSYMYARKVVSVWGEGAVTRIGIAFKASSGEIGIK